ncbi:hypothetical protein CC1G_06730 [Coprinopsis cinerea okayama7|uniref:YDG domain-containing protein n=1 Tax=Coprinopsis cinerea (strain Okayama-7 / 130 / ATCC MYA-4618 / FGSC 9003) TaxID=240176 RepID=A8N1Q0_COPC7|nr:hypothetical protein CC1G_06730 [Coprinopsis cinerea okayama7\|eukprot:XP_001828744.2 hypothetical protein CC1G_06730 [Coprinopsis cinerea okayama7\
MPALSEYERQRQENIKRNQELLKSLGLDGPISALLEPKAQKTKPAPKKSKKRKTEAQELGDTRNGDDTEEPASKAQRSEQANDVSEAPIPGPRRSARNAGKKIDYTKELKTARNMPLTTINDYDKQGSDEIPKKGTLDPSRFKIFGHIPGIEVGTWWAQRAQCSADGVHAPYVQGISGGKNGAYSVALSGGYDDDVDMGYAFTYTGSGGRDLKGTPSNRKNLRTAPQSSDQTFENLANKALLKSTETKKPVRVIRGYKVPSKYAPYEGYRYDGLYTVEKAWMERGLSGFLVCKYAFKRLPGQPPLPVREETEEAAIVEQGGEGSVNEYEETTSVTT